MKLVYSEYAIEQLQTILNFLVYELDIFDTRQKK